MCNDFFVLQAADPETARKIDEFIEKLQDCLNGKRQFTFVSVLLDCTAQCTMDNACDKMHEAIP